MVGDLLPNDEVAEGEITISGLDNELLCVFTI
jgi:hypothetical protein